MPLPVCTITGTVYLVDGSLAANVTINVLKVLKNGVLISTKNDKFISDAAGIVTLTLPRASVAYLSSKVEGLEAIAAGYALEIPDAPTATLESLVPVTLIPATGLTHTFLSLADTPDAFVDQSLKTVRVNIGESALEFVTGSGATWGGVTGVLSAQTDLQDELDLKAPKASPTFTGVPSAPTVAIATNTTQIATTEYVHDMVEDLIGTAPANLNTLQEIAAQLSVDESAVAAIVTTLAGKSNIPTVNTQSGTTYTFQTTDNGNIVHFTSATAVTATIPASLGTFLCFWKQAGAGQVTFVGSGATVNNRQLHTKSAGQWAGGSLEGAANVITLLGDTAA